VDDSERHARESALMVAKSPIASRWQNCIDGLAAMIRDQRPTLERGGRIFTTQQEALVLAKEEKRLVQDRSRRTPLATSAGERRK